MFAVLAGLAMAADKTMYFADGTNIRSVDPDGIIHTLIGHHRHLNLWQPIPCRGALPAKQVRNKISQLLFLLWHSNCSHYHT